MFEKFFENLYLNRLYEAIKTSDANSVKKILSTKYKYLVEKEDLLHFALKKRLIILKYDRLHKNSKEDKLYIDETYTYKKTDLEQNYAIISMFLDLDDSIHFINNKGYKSSYPLAISYLYPQIDFPLNEKDIRVEYDIVKLLVKKGADPKLFNGLDYALKFNQSKAIEIFSK